LATHTNSKVISVLFLLLAFCSVLSAGDVGKKEFFKSLVLPGWGEVSSNHSSGYFFIASEALIWSSKFYCKQEQNLKDEQSYLQALKYAHINRDVSFDETYIELLKRYNSSGFESGGYNEQVLKQAVELFPDSKEDQDLYIETHKIPDEKAWNWDDRYKRHDFAVMRKRILQYSNYLKISTGLLLANRLFSLINLTRINKVMKMDVSLNKNLDTVVSLKISF